MADSPSSSHSEQASTNPKFRVVGHRRFLTKGNNKYLLPADELEMDRLDYQHSIIKIVRKANFEAPVEALLRKGIKVLDVGCGSGKWLLEMAQEYPCSVFFGIDIVDVFPQSIPPNCTFQKADVLKGLPFEDDAFDFVFQRLMLLSFTKNDWLKDMKELTRVTAPGGFVELFETSFVLEQPPPAYTRFFNAVRAATQARDIDITFQHDLVHLLGTASLVNIQSDQVSCPIGWYGRVGELAIGNMRQLFSSMKPILSIAMGLSEREYDRIINEILDGFGKHRTWCRGLGAYGTKPYIL